jgi:Zn-dependent protease
MINTLFTNPIYFIISLIALFVAITVHEYSHAWMAERLGDPTPRLQGRLSFNPLVHIDLTGLLFLLFFGFGWGKPVPFDPYNLRNPRKDAALISIAGPGSNFILAILLSLILRLFTFFNLSNLFTIGSVILIPTIALNVILGLFNLLPVSPLDGFKIVGGILDEERAREWYQLERYGILFLLLLILPIGGATMLDSILRPALNTVLRFLIPLASSGGIV